jgi:hypothetical protein
MTLRVLIALTAALTVCGCVTVTDSENVTVYTPPPVRLTDWMEQQHYHTYSTVQANRVCYREVLHNHGYTVIREINCLGRVLSETRRYNRIY